MKIADDFIAGNDRIRIISNGGKPVKIPKRWQPVLKSCEILVVIPDMHMYIYNSNLDNFKYGAKAMLSFLDHLEILKEEMALIGKTLRIYQIGDVYEQRFPGLGSMGANATATEIRMSHPVYDQIINTMNGMRTHFLYGNHDFELRHFPGFTFAANEGKVYLEHGFTNDTWKDFSNPGAVFWEVSQLIFKTIREINQFFASMLVQANIIGKDDNYSFGVRSGKEPDYNYLSEKDYEERYGVKYFDYYAKRIKNIPEMPDAKICIIGHTHHPYIDPKFNEGKGIYIDAGSWTEGRSDFAVVTNEEAAICCYLRE
jgi:UDP-2,3-diacylglucosamine pyrophosphatase LpxH